jgi:archaellum component FlaC
VEEEEEEETETNTQLQDIMETLNVINSTLNCTVVKMQRRKKTSKSAGDWKFHR